MAYIGKTPVVGNFVKLDAITATATTTFNLTNGGVAYYPQSPNHCLVSLNGILQAPTDSFTISGSNIVFSSALTTSDVIDFIIVLGDVLNIGTPSDNTVSLAKLTATGTKDSTTFLRGDNTFAAAGATAGTVIQLKTATDSTERSSSSSTFQTNSTLSISITPASTSNKIVLMIFNLSTYSSGGNTAVSIFRDSTNLGDSTYGLFNQNDDTFIRMWNYCYEDSPSSTSSITYQVRYRAFNYGSATIIKPLNANASPKAILVAMEVKG